MTFCSHFRGASHLCICTRVIFFLCLVGPSVSAAPPNGNAAASLPNVDADTLRPGHFVGTIVRAPDSDRMFTLKITYPEVRLKPGAKMPNLNYAHAQYMNNQYRQMINLQRQMARLGHHHIHNMMQMQQMYMQMQWAEQQAIARMQQQELQQELRLLQQEIRAIQNMYQVVSVSRNVDFQADANVKVRLKNLPDQFDAKGRSRKYTREELAALKGKDKELIGYESSMEALHPGQVVMATLRSHKKSHSSMLSTTASKKKKADDTEADSTIEHKMQVSMIVILKDGNAPPPANSAKNKKKK
jgi:hypothetical protein